MERKHYDKPYLRIECFCPNEYCTPCKTELTPFTEKWGSNIYLDFNSNDSYNAGEFYAGNTTQEDGTKKSIDIYELQANTGTDWNKLESLPSLTDGISYTGGQFNLLIDGFTEEVPVKFNKLGTADVLIKDGVAYRNHS